MKKLLTLTLVMVFVLGLAGTVGAFPEGGKVGQNVDEEYPDGTVTRVEFIEDYAGDWQVIMPYRGDFEGDENLVNGWVINVITDRGGNLILYILVSDDDPRHSEDLDGYGYDYGDDWRIFKVVVAGKSFSAGR